MQKKVFTRECQESSGRMNLKTVAGSSFFLDPCEKKGDIADFYMKEEDLKWIPAMSADVNEQIRAQFDSLEKGKKAEDVSDYMI